MWAMPSTTRIALTVVILTAAAACKSHRSPPAAAAPDSSATAAVPAPSPAAPPPSPSGVHLANPHSLSDAELRFGVSPTRSDKVTYQDNVVVMEHGAEAIRAANPDGMTWTFDANAPQVKDIQPGKVILATSRAAGKVLAVTRSGNDVSVILGPAEITDFLKEADVEFNQPVDFQQMVAYTAANYPGTADEMDKLTADAGDDDGTSITTAVLSPSGDVTPVSLVSGPAPRRAAAGTWTDADVARFRNMQLSSMPTIPGVGPPNQTDISDFHASPFCCDGGLGMKLLHDGDDMKVIAYLVLRLSQPSVHFNLKISGATIRTAKVELYGAAGLTVHIESATAKGSSGNINRRFFLPVDLTIPVVGMGVPFAITLHQQFLLQTAFTAKNSTLNTTGDYGFGGTIWMGYDNGGWGVGAPTQLHVNQSLGQSLDGLSLGVTGLVFGMEGRVIVGIGAFGMATGPFLGYSTVVGLTRGSDQAKMLVGVTCRGTILDLGLNVGIGYQIPQPVTKAINSILKTLNLSPIQGSGGPKHSENLVHKSQDNPKGCAYGSK
jgi:hypothetical protein